MKGFKDKSGKFRPTENKNGIRKSRDQTAKNNGVQLTQKRMKRDKVSTAYRKIKELEKDFERGLSEYDFDNKHLKNLDWDVNVTYTGSHGTVDSEYFTVTAVNTRGIGTVETHEAFSNDDWSQGMDDDSGYMKKLDEDSDFAEKEYDKWLAEMLDVYKEGMFQNLVTMIEETYEEGHK